MIIGELTPEQEAQHAKILRLTEAFKENTDDSKDVELMAEIEREIAVYDSLRMKTKIEWTDCTWNPIRGCSVVSEGCRNCYAMNVGARFSDKGLAYEGLAYRNSSGAHWTGKVKLVEEHLGDPLRWQKPRRVFVNSMSDLFHESIGNETIASIFAVMALAEQHTFQILTKRPQRMLEWFQWIVKSWPELEPMHESVPPDANVVHVHGPHNDAAYIRRLRMCEDDFAAAWPLPNIWLGVSVEDQKTADERIPLLLDTPAAIRWLSIEPLLSPVDVFPYLETRFFESAAAHMTSKVDWVVVGGESGARARPMNIDWMRLIISQCRAAHVPVFAKQIGSKPMWDGCGLVVNNPKCLTCEDVDTGLVRLLPDDRKGGDINEWPEDLRVREFPSETTKETSASK